MDAPPLLRLRRLGQALVRRTDELIAIVSRLVPPSGRRPPRQQPATPPPPRPLPAARQRVRRVLSPLEKYALTRVSRRQPVAPAVERVSLERPHPHRRVPARPAVRPVFVAPAVSRPHATRPHAAAISHVRVPPPPYYPRFAPIR